MPYYTHARVQQDWTGSSRAIELPNTVDGGIVTLAVIGNRWLAASIVTIASSVAGHPTIQSDAAVARTQLDVARHIRREAVAIVAIAPRSVVAEDPNAPPFRKQNYTVSGHVVRCFKGPVRPPTQIAYIITAEGRPASLEKPHVAFLRRMGQQWAAVEGPMFRDSAPMRAGLARMTPGCSR